MSERVNECAAACDCYAAGEPEVILRNLLLWIEREKNDAKHWMDHSDSVIDKAEHRGVLRKLSQVDGLIKVVRGEFAKGKARTDERYVNAAATDCSTASVNPTHHTCCTCGYVWRHGEHGGHSCSDRLKDRVERLESALQRIEQWFGVFPDTGQFWDDEKTRPMTYGACYGSNGERDFMRQIARDALQ